MAWGLARSRCVVHVGSVVVVVREMRIPVRPGVGFLRANRGPTAGRVEWREVSSVAVGRSSDVLLLLLPLKSSRD